MQHRERMFTTKFDKIYYCVPAAKAHRHQKVFDELRQICPNLEVIMNLPPLGIVTETLLPKLLILDDLKDMIFGCTKWSQMFTQTSHHDSVSIIFTSQNYFSGRTKDIIRNITQTVVFEKVGSESYMRSIGQSITSRHPNILLHIFDVLDELYPLDKYKYILIDQENKSEMRRLPYRSDIFPNENGVIEPICFLPKSSEEI